MAEKAILKQQKDYEKEVKKKVENVKGKFIILNHEEGD